MCSIRYRESKAYTNDKYKMLLFTASSAQIAAELHAALAMWDRTVASNASAGHFLGRRPSTSRRSKRCARGRSGAESPRGWSRVRSEQQASGSRRGGAGCSGMSSSSQKGRAGGAAGSRWRYWCDAGEPVAAFRVFELAAAFERFDEDVLGEVLGVGDIAHDPVRPAGRCGAVVETKRFWLSSEFSSRGSTASLMTGHTKLTCAYIL